MLSDNDLAIDIPALKESVREVASRVSSEEEFDAAEQQLLTAHRAQPLEPAPEPTTEEAPTDNQKDTDKKEKKP